MRLSKNGELLRKKGEIKFGTYFTILKHPINQVIIYNV